MDIIDRAIAWWTDVGEENYECFNEVKEAILTIGLLDEGKYYTTDILKKADENREQIKEELIKRRLLKC